MNLLPDYYTKYYTTSGPALAAMRSGETKKHNNGPTKTHHVVVTEAADWAGESSALYGLDLVNHDAALLAKTIRGGRLDCEPNQWSLGWVGRKRTNRY